MWLGTGFASTSELFNAGCPPMSNQQQRLAVLLREEDPTLHDQSSVTSEDLLHIGQLLWTIYRNGIEDLWCSMALPSSNFFPHLDYGLEWLGRGGSLWRLVLQRALNIRPKAGWNISANTAVSLNWYKWSRQLLQNNCLIYSWGGTHPNLSLQNSLPLFIRWGNSTILASGRASGQTHQYQACGKTIWQYVMEVHIVSDSSAYAKTFNNLSLPSWNTGITFQIKFQYNIKEWDVNRDKVCDTEVNQRKQRLRGNPTRETHLFHYYITDDIKYPPSPSRQNSCIKSISVYQAW